VSAHQSPFFPQTGAADETGLGAGAGFTVNLPLEVGAADDDYRIVFGEVVVPVLRQFEPELILVSAGFDAHERDPMAGMRLTAGAFGAMTMELRAVAEECCGGRIAAVTEGGYDLLALGESLQAVIHALAAPTVAIEWAVSGGPPSRRGWESADRTRGALTPFWRL
jgi:acetoin utilization deacetylase AcuC-like enzyme